jgi:hypothetical protein
VPAGGGLNLGASGSAPEECEAAFQGSLMSEVERAVLRNGRFHVSRPNSPAAASQQLPAIDQSKPQMRFT